MNPNIERVLLIRGRETRILVELSNTSTVLITPLYEHYEIHDPLYEELVRPVARRYNGWLHGRSLPEPLPGIEPVEMTGLQYHEARLQAMQVAEMRDELWNLGYRCTQELPIGERGVDELDQDEVYDKLREWYRQEEKVY